jgi:hypothetical protein
LKEKTKERALSLKEITPFFSGKGKILALIFFCIPFSQIFGLAIPFGVIIAYLGFSYAFSNKTWMPRFILKKKISRKVLKFVVNQLLWFIKIIAKFSRPRLLWMCTQPVMRKINGCLVGLIGIFIAISLPIPLSSYIASAAILFLGIGLLNDDGIWMMIGHPIAIFYIVFVIVTLQYISIIDIIRRFF